MLSKIQNFYKNQRGSLWKILWLGIVVYAAFQFVVICKTAVNIPYMDEMELFNKDGIVLGWSKDFILGFLLDHRIILTKISYLLNYALFDLNFRYQIIFIALCHVILAWTVWKTIGAKIGDGKSLAALLAFLPFISTLHVESHSRALTIGKHLALLAFVGGAYLLFHKRGWLFFFLGLFLWGFALLGGSTGVGGIAAIGIFYITWIFFTKEDGYLLKAPLTLFVIGTGVYFILHGLPKISIHPEFTPPWTPQFFHFMAENIALGFGFTSLNPYVSTLCFYIVLSALLAAIWFCLKKGKDPQAGFLIALTVGILGMIGAVTFGRAGFSLGHAKLSRYAEVSVFLPLLSVALFYLSASSLRLGSLCVVLFLAVGLVDNFTFSKYRTTARFREEGFRCVQGLLQHPEDNPSGVCRTLFPYSIKERMERAQEMAVSFTRR